MKKKVSLALAVAMATSVGATAMAAPANPFSDVPSKHWSYNAVQQLAKAGIVDGFNDGTFKGDKTMTRYEMATIVARAMAKVDKADAQQKAMIDKLAAEYSTELQNLGVRVTNLENKVGNIKWDGYARFRMEQTPAGSNNNVKDTTGRTRLRLNITAPLNDDWTVKGRLQWDSRESLLNDGTSANDNGSMQFASLYATGKGLGLDQISVGRVPVWLGQGFIADIKGSNGNTSPDSLVIGKNFGSVNAFYGIGRTYKPYNSSTNTMNINYAGLTAPITDTLAFDASYLKDNKDEWYKTWGAGLKYTGLQNFTLSGEYAQNKSKNAKFLQNGSAAKAYQVQLKYKGADKKAVNTWGTWVAFNKFDAGFDPADFTTTDMSVKQISALTLTGLKGQEYGIEYVPFKNGVLSFKYENYKTTSTANYSSFNTPKKAYIGQLEVFF